MAVSREQIIEGCRRTAVVLALSASVMWLWMSAGTLEKFSTFFLHPDIKYLKLLLADGFSAACICLGVYYHIQLILRYIIGGFRDAVPDLDSAVDEHQIKLYRFFTIFIQSIALLGAFLLWAVLAIIENEVNWWINVAGLGIYSYLLIGAWVKLDQWAENVQRLTDCIVPQRRKSKCTTLEIISETIAQEGSLAALHKDWTESPHSRDFLLEANTARIRTVGGARLDELAIRSPCISCYLSSPGYIREAVELLIKRYDEKSRGIRDWMYWEDWRWHDLAILMAALLCVMALFFICIFVAR